MTPSNRRILVTGANGFIGKNLMVRLRESPDVTVSTFVRGDEVSNLPMLVANSDCVVHLAAENRPNDEAAFTHVNSGLTTAICNAIQQEFNKTNRHVSLVLASSTQAEMGNPYGRSKLAAERAIQALAISTGNPCVSFRLPGVFGKWCKPNYNSVVATFCHNLARDLPIHINDPQTTLRLVHVDDVVTALLNAVEALTPGYSSGSVSPEYTITLGELAEQIRAFSRCRTSLMSERVGAGLVRALYSTYVSYLPNDRFSYGVPRHVDPRGVFVELLKTPDSGQFSCFTAHPGITRGGHYHHTKTEKFLVIKGEARFRFRNLLTSELVEIRTSGETPQVVDTIPGWVHEITNVGSDEMVVMLWANEIFDRQRPDTIAAELGK
jgi:UDP-2-acetamido-2,6-beta-L-arabino-hexul-4-ose reductase